MPTSRTAVGRRWLRRGPTNERFHVPLALVSQCENCRSDLCGCWNSLEPPRGNMTFRAETSEERQTMRGSLHRSQKLNVQVECALITTGQIVTILRNTLQQLERNGTFRSEDPALIHLKRQLVLAIAELEMRKDVRSSAERERPVVVLRARKSTNQTCQQTRNSELELCREGD